MDNLAIHVQGIRVCSAKMKEVFDLAKRKGADPVNASDITGELQSLSTQLYYVLVMMLSDQAQEIVRNSPEGIGAEVWRKLLWEYEPGVGIRYGAMLQSLLKRRFGEHEETDLAREIESFGRPASLMVNAGTARRRSTRRRIAER